MTTPAVRAELQSPTDLGANAIRDIPAALRAPLADVFALYVKTKNFHWHMSGSHFRDYHLMLDEQSDQIFAMTDDIAERARKIGGTTIRSIGHIKREQRILDNDAVCDPSGYGGRTSRRQSTANIGNAPRSRALRSVRRRCNSKRSRKLDRSD